MSSDNAAVVVRPILSENAIALMGLYPTHHEFIADYPAIIAGGLCTPAEASAILHAYCDRKVREGKSAEYSIEVKPDPKTGETNLLIRGGAGAPCKVRKDRLQFVWTKEGQELFRAKSLELGIVID